MQLITFIDPVPQSEGMYYATNNPYQVSGPKGFTEFKYIEGTMDLFMRVDFPGVIRESVKTTVKGSDKKAVFVSGNTPKELTHDSSEPEIRNRHSTCL
ncbi:unnamed protein product [Microthlaspi erraticum]|uniref:SHSP domain-containing protein n=1 Tax=Microthlaspi erraticum TaxID=1685480 RepID=A0A6D2I5N7_9BRAS|nr:unnamed protein product [Microthlaspi erraticum]